MAALTTALVVAGLAASAYGAYTSYEGAKGQAGAQQQQIQLEQQAEEQRKQAMETNARRMTLENTRNVIRARATSLSNATNQGAQFGSGLQGGFGEAAGQGAYNQEGINSGLQTGENLFQINSQISQAKIAYSQAGTQIALGSAISSVGKSVAGSAGPASNLFSSFGGDKSGPYSAGAGGYKGEGPFLP